jgi:hypothetical protein
MKTKIFFDIEGVSHSKNEDFLVHVLFDTASQSVNAIEGTIVLDPSLEIKEIRDGDSVLKFWVEAPHIDTKDIKFSGIAPGGFNTSDGKLFSILLHTKQAGNVAVSARDIKVLKNDGKGGQLENTIQSSQIKITNEVSEQTVLVTDTDAPEVFQPEISRDNSLFGGKYFVAFSAQDKGSGIKSYEVKEGFFGSFAPAQSPYELSNQGLYKTVYVKAIDKSGNERVVTVKATHLSPVEYVGIAIIVVAGVVLLVRKIWKRNSLKH